MKLSKKTSSREALCNWAEKNWVKKSKETWTKNPTLLIPQRWSKTADRAIRLSALRNGSDYDDGMWERKPRYKNQRRRRLFGRDLSDSHSLPPPACWILYLTANTGRALQPKAKKLNQILLTKSYRARSKMFRFRKKKILFWIGKQDEKSDFEPSSSYRLLYYRFYSSIDDPLCPNCLFFIIELRWKQYKYQMRLIIS